LQVDTVLDLDSTQCDIPGAPLVRCAEGEVMRGARCATVAAATLLFVVCAGAPGRADIVLPVPVGGQFINTVIHTVEPLPSVPPPPPPTSAELASVALAAVRAKNDYLVTGALGIGASESEFSPRYSAWLATVMPDLDARRTELVATGVKYVSHTETLTAKSLLTTSAAATFVADVESRFGMRGTGTNTGVPATTATGEELHFVFTVDASGWTVQRVDTNDVGGVYYTSEGSVVDEVADTHQPPGEPVADAASPVVTDLGVVPSVDISDMDGSQESSRRLANRSDVVSYAIAHSGVNGHAINSAYKYFEGSDCTNFVSQALYNGGWPMTNHYNGDPNWEWWYNSGSDYVSSWTVAWQL
jgi:hypothetical protein